MPETECVDLYSQFKSRKLKKLNKFETGHTYRNFRKSDFLLHNTHQLFYEHRTSTSKNVNKHLKENNLTMYGDYLSKDEQFLRRNKPSLEVPFSLNKKKRWLIFDELKDLAKNELKYQNLIDEKDKKKDDHKNEDVAFRVFSFDTALFKYERFSSYFDNNGIEVINGDQNYRSFDYSIRGFRASARRARLQRRLKNENSKKKFKIQFKNGNRDRNSGILRKKRKNIKNIITEEKDNKFYDQIDSYFSFLIPTKKYKSKKSWRSGIEKIVHEFIYPNYHYTYHYETEYRLRRLKYKTNLNSQDEAEAREICDLKSNLCEEFNSILTPTCQSKIVFQDLFDFVCKESKLYKLTSKKEQPSLIRNSERKIVYLENDDYLKKNLKPDEYIQKKSVPQSNINNSVSIFKKIAFKTDLTRDELLSSIKELINSNENEIVFDRLKVQINPANFLSKSNKKIESLIKNYYLLTRLVYDINEQDKILVNFYYSNPFDDPNINVLIDFQDKIESFSHLVVNICSQILKSLENIDIKSLERQNSVKKSDLGKFSHILGKYSSVNIHDLFKINENYLNNLTSKTKMTSHFKIEEKSIRTCDICYADYEWPSEFYQLENCEHHACVECWQVYLRTQIQNMKVTSSFSNEKNGSSAQIKQICCLYDKCNQPIALNSMYMLIESEFVHKYVKYFTDLQIIRNRNEYSYCKNKKCEKIILLNKEENSNLKSFNDFVKLCECGQAVCKFCLEEMHFPALCTQAKLYFKDLKKFEELKVNDASDLYSSEGKNCPNCDNYMEKNQGCNRMSCPCGFQFCWLCLKNFDGFHSASDGFFCRYGQVELTNYDSAHFVSINRILKNKKTNLYEIIIRQRIKRNNLTKKYEMNSILSRLKSFIGALLIKSARNFNRQEQNTRRNDDKLFTLLKLNRTEFDYSKFEFAKCRIEEFITQINTNIVLLNRIIEFLALLLSGSNKLFKIKSSCKSLDYSFKPNLYKTLQKSINLTSTIEDLIMNFDQSKATMNPFTFIDKIIFYNSQIDRLFLNIKHLVVDNLKIYEKSNNQACVKNERQIV
jgi:hypothetical protein